MRKLFFFIILVILLSGCNIIQKRTTDQQPANLEGTEGLVLTLPKLPAELYVGQGLEIPVTLENQGASNVENAILAIPMYGETIVQFRQPPIFEGINLEGRSLLVPLGEKTTKVFTISSIKLPSEKEISKTFEVIACYQYKTEASPVVCINPKSQLTQDTTKPACEFVDAILTPTQGAPIAVTKVENWYYIDRNEVEFRIFVKDVFEKGVLLKKSAYAKRCLSGEALDTGDLGTINIEAYMSGKKIDCYSVASDEFADNFVIRENMPSIRCRAKIDFNEPAYTTPLSLYLSYGYNVGKVFTINLKSPLIS